LRGWSHEHVSAVCAGSSAMRQAMGAGVGAMYAARTLGASTQVAYFYGGAGASIGASLGWNAGQASCPTISRWRTDLSNALCMSNAECRETVASLEGQRILNGLAADFAVCPNCTLEQLLGQAFSTWNERQRKLDGFQYLNTGRFTGAYVIPHSAFWSGVRTAPMGSFWQGVASGIGGSGGGPSYDVQ
jgi:hypothetical protein